jgi:hypothetical protein
MQLVMLIRKAKADPVKKSSSKDRRRIGSGTQAVVNRNEHKA